MRLRPNMTPEICHKLEGLDIKMTRNSLKTSTLPFFLKKQLSSKKNEKSYLICYF